ncbi:GntR family transcriptional regulator [Microbacterium bovistercoris]|uniref:GntR family transcriptional regulator n=1 Tax=Microbacterium bovistercoris TaxID=2293570 RepID=A0A371NWK0_9MICO|nr:GntR family transcriptional regulator [Microbacterium bovistercoris]REJ07477.1 GntR family transcriptional regulator [Microbacterium bovistercoris]
MPEIDIAIDPGSAIPPFEQLRDGLRERIASGGLRPGTKLPPVRTLATSLGLAANTVARSYRELEAEGFVETRGRGGTVVAPRLDSPQRHQRMLELTREYVAAVDALGVDRAEIPGYLGRV